MGEVIQGDILDCLKQIEDCHFDLIIADPNFNQKKEKWYKDQVDDSMDDEEYYQWSENWIKESFRVLKDTGSIYIYINSKHSGNLQVIGKKYGIWRNTIVWHYTNPIAPKRPYPKTYSNFLFFSKTNEYTFHEDACLMRSHYTNYMHSRQLLETNRLYDVWHDISKLVPGYLAQKECIVDTKGKRVCTYQLPERCLERIILTSSNEGDMIGDFFSHSGTASYVAQKKNRDFRAIEKVEEFCKVISKRTKKRKGLGLI